MTAKDLIAAFKFLDTDSDGHVEFTELAKLSGEHLNKDEQEFLKTHGDYLFGLADQSNDMKLDQGEYLGLMACVRGEPAFMWASKWADWSDGKGYIPIDDVAKGWAALDRSVDYGMVYAQLKKFDTEDKSGAWISLYEFWDAFNDFYWFSRAADSKSDA